MLGFLWPPKLMYSTFSGEAVRGKQQVLKYLVPLYVRVVGHIEPLDACAPTPDDALTLQMSTAPQVVLRSLQVLRHIRRVSVTRTHSHRIPYFTKTNEANSQLFPAGSHQLLLCDSGVFTTPFSPNISRSF